jgi:hypothetical protein
VLQKVSDQHISDSRSSDEGSSPSIYTCKICSLQVSLRLWGPSLYKSQFVQTAQGAPLFAENAHGTKDSPCGKQTYHALADGETAQELGELI